MEKLSVHEAISRVLAEVGPIAKDRQNKQQGYAFRGIDDMYNTVHNLLAKYGLFTVPQVLEAVTSERESKSGGTLFFARYKVRYMIYGPQGDSIEAIVYGDGMDSGDKAGNKAMSAAHKYLFIQLFSIPTAGAVDSEDDDHDVRPAKKAPEKHVDDPSVALGTLKDVMTLKLTQAAKNGLYDEIEFEKAVNAIARCKDVGQAQKMADLLDQRIRERADAKVPL